MSKVTSASPGPSLGLAGTVQAGPLDERQVAELARAYQRLKPIRRACAFAKFNAWTTAVFAGLSLLFCITGSVVALVMALGLTVVAFNEFRGGSMLRRLSPAGAILLACNQAGFGLLLMGYAAWMLIASSGGPTVSSQLAVADPELAAMMESLERLAFVVVYGGVAAVGLIVPGLTALYYLSRGGHLRRYRQETPEWARTALERVLLGGPTPRRARP